MLSVEANPAELFFPMRSFPCRLSSRALPIRAFTLIELLVVISIIAVLAGLLLPVGNKVIENSKKVSAKTTMLQIVSAVKNYQSEYGTYPVAIAAAAGGGAATATDTTYDDTDSGSTTGKAGHNGALFEVLRALNSTDTSNTALQALNARRISYFEYKDVKNTAVPRDGFIPTPAAGATATDIKGARDVIVKPGDLVDPWGNLYYVRIDTGYSDRVMDPFQSATLDDGAGTSVADNQVVHTAVIAWTLGSGLKQWSATGGSAVGTYESSGNVATWR